jgi:alpha-L-fucosidase 2
VDIEGKSGFEVQADMEIWRTSRSELKGLERHAVYGLYDSPAPVFREPDQLLNTGNDRVVWHHRNERSIWSDNLNLQALGDLTRTMADPLLHRTFGGTLRGDGMVRITPTSLKSTRPRRQCRLMVTLLTSQTDTPEIWLKQLEELTTRNDAISTKTRLAAHRRWWLDFWSRSYIFVSGDAEAERITQGYTLQRFINACAGRGASPIKFNGSLFTVDAVYQGQRFDADFRLWGGPYWFQNTRLPYWSMLASGDFDLMQPLFGMYTNSLPLARSRTQRYYGHEGAFWPETMYFWGTYNDDNYGRDRQGKPDGLTDNRFIRYYWQSGLELVMMMLDYYEFTRDEKFLRTVLLPIATNVTTFFDEHWSRDGQGKIRFDPAMALETYHVAVNPSAEIAALRAVLPRLLALTSGEVPNSQTTRWQRTLADLPELPLVEREGKQLLSPAEQFSNKANIENPELYAVFPYRLFTIGRPNLDLALRSFENRIHKDSGGWQQDAIQAALLGRVDDAARMVAGNFSRSNPQCRFPAFWGPNFDWTPDQDHGCVPMIALQRMLLQADEGKLLLLPAWPKRWNVDFRLHAPNRTTVEAEFRDGKLQRCKVLPGLRSEVWKSGKRS